MNQLAIPLDPLNPGQFFACCGLFELVVQSSPEARAAFAANEFSPRKAVFTIEGADLPSLPSLLETIGSAGYSAAPESDRVEDSVRPVSVTLSAGSYLLDWWLDPFWERTTSLKCWAGQVTTRKLFEELPPLIRPSVDPEGLMNASAKTKSKFGVDPRSAWNALDFGFSPNTQGMDSETYPAVEILSAFGLQSFRPDAERRSGVAYCLWTVPLPLPIARLAAFAAWDGLPCFEYAFNIAKRGQSYKFFEFAEFKHRKVYFA